MKNKVYKQISFSETGGPDVLCYSEKRPSPLGDNETLIEHSAIGVNFIDIYHRSGLYPAALPSGLGTEAAGQVVEIGKNVTRVKIGDRVAYAAGSLGAYSEAHTVHENNLILLPEGIGDELAAAMLLKGLTAAYLLLVTFPLKSDHTLLTHAAVGGVGSILTQWAKAIGARVIGTVGRPEKVALAKQQGCDTVLLYRECDVAAEVKSLTEHKGVDVVYDSVGKDTFNCSIDSLKRRGMMVSFGNASGAVADFPPLLLAKKGSLFFTRPTLADYVADPIEQQFLADALFDRVLSGDITVKVNHRFKLDDAATAHTTLESGNTTGSIILTP